MPNCEYYLDLVSAELDGELTEAEKADLTAHLTHCDACRRYRDALLSVEEALDELVEPPVTLAKSVMARVNALPVPGAAKPAKKTNRSLWRSLRSASLAAVAVFAILAGVNIFSPKGAMKAAAPMAAPAAMDMAAPESVMEDGAPNLTAGMSRAAEAELHDTTPAEAAPMEAPAAMEPHAEEFAAYSAKDRTTACVDVYKDGELLLTTEDTIFWEFIQTRLLTAAEPAEIPAGEADYELTLFYPGGNVEYVTLWVTGDNIYWQFTDEEIAFRSAAEVKEFLNHIL